MNNEENHKYYKILYTVIILILILSIVILGILIYNEKLSAQETIKNSKYNNIVEDFGIEYSTYSENENYERILQNCGKYQIIDNYKQYCEYLSQMKNYNNYFHGKIQMGQEFKKINDTIKSKEFFNNSNVLLFKVSKDKIYNIEDMKISNIRYDDDKMSLDMLSTYTDYSRVNAETGYIFMIPIDKQVKTAKINIKWTGTKDIK